MVRQCDYGRELGHQLITLSDNRTNGSNNLENPAASVRIGRSESRVVEQPVKNDSAKHFRRPFQRFRNDKPVGDASGANSDDKRVAISDADEPLSQK